MSWTGLFDRTYTGRHLPPAPDSYVNGLPSPDRVRRLFVREKLTPCPKSTALFAFFAQWFTDSFLRTDPVDSRKNTSNHEIDLCQIYGLNADVTSILRSHTGGLLRSETIGGQEYPERLFGADGLVKQHFLDLPYIDKNRRDYVEDVNESLKPFADNPQRKAYLFATGLERGNSTIFYSALNTIFLREHNRLCRAMAKQYPNWDDAQLFETARNTNIVQLLRIIIEDYINHISTARFRLFIQPGLADRQRWYRTNRIAAEFDLLYRWHALAPTDIKLGTELPNQDFRYNNKLLIDGGVEAIFEQGSRQHAGKITLHNTAPFLLDAEVAALQKSRVWRIAPYNDYRERFKLGRMASFEELTNDKKLAAELEELYGTIDNVEFIVGLLAEQRQSYAMMGELMMVMVGVDAFSQALTNPLLANDIYGATTFSEVGMEAIAASGALVDIVGRNARPSTKASFDISMTN